MAEEITELENKYLVLKWKNIDMLDQQSRIIFDEIIKQLQVIRCKDSGKSITVYGKNHVEYLVLNLDDEADINCLVDAIEAHRPSMKSPYIAIKDIAVNLVNAVLKAKRARERV